MGHTYILLLHIRKCLPAFLSLVPWFSLLPERTLGTRLSLSAFINEIRNRQHALLKSNIYNYYRVTANLVFSPLFTFPFNAKLTSQRCSLYYIF